jgi:biotin operon repressor
MRKTVEKHLKAVRRDDSTLWFVPEEQRTAEVCVEAVRQDGYALYHVPEELKDAVREACDFGRLV